MGEYSRIYESIKSCVLCTHDFHIFWRAFLSSLIQLTVVLFFYFGGHCSINFGHFRTGQAGHFQKECSGASYTSPFSSFRNLPRPFSTTELRVAGHYSRERTMCAICSPTREGFHIIGRSTAFLARWMHGRECCRSIELRLRFLYCVH